MNTKTNNHGGRYVTTVKNPGARTTTAAVRDSGTASPKRVERVVRAGVKRYSSTLRSLSK